jgi:hypothetical protein
VTSDGKQSARPARSGAGALRVALAVLVVGGAALAIAYYGENITGYFAQQGWNPAAPEQVVRRFVQLSTQPNGGQEAAALLDPGAADAYRPAIEGGRIVRITHGQGLSRRTDPLKVFVPGPEITGVQTDLLYRDGGVFRVLVQFGGRQWGEFRVRRGGGERRIVQLPSGFFSTPPERHTYEY